MSREKAVEDYLENKADYLRNECHLDRFGEQFIGFYLCAALKMVAKEMAAANDLNAKFIESHEERIDPLFKIPEFDREEFLSNLQSSLEKPAMKRLRDFNVGDEVWVKVKIQDLEDEDGDIEVSVPRKGRDWRGCAYIDGTTEAHQ